MRRVLESPLYQLAALLALVAISDWLGRHTWLRQLGGALLVIVLAAVCVNIGLLPKHVAGGDGPPPVTQLVYDQRAELPTQSKDTRIPRAMRGRCIVTPEEC
jgi:hypothetical protein